MGHRPLNDVATHYLYSIRRPHLKKYTGEWSLECPFSFPHVEKQREKKKGNHFVFTPSVRRFQQTIIK